MSCEHTGPLELMQMAEQYLQREGLPDGTWSGTRFRFAENVPDGMWASVCLEIERRGGEWIVTRLDRNREPLAEEETGFRPLTPLESRS